MSIIHDALKKAQNSLQGKTDGGAAKDGAKGGWKIIILILLAAAVLTAGYVYWQGRPSKNTVASLPPPVPSPPAKQEQPPPQGGVNATPEPKPEPRPAHADTLNIHGIMSDPKGNVVLIDNGIYAEGDEVQGVKIIKISIDGIVILKDGKEETIRVGQH